MSQKFPIEMRELRTSPGIVCPARAYVGNWSSWSCNSCVARMADPLGMPTTIGGGPLLYGLCGALVSKKCLVTPVSATLVRMVVVGYRCCARLTSFPRFRLPTCTAPMSQTLGLFHILPFSVLVCVVSSRCTCRFLSHVVLLCPTRTLNPWDQQYLLVSIGTDSLVIVPLDGFGDLVPCVLANRAFFATRNFTCTTSAVLVSTNFLFMVMRSATMLRFAVAASAILSSAVGISVVSWSIWALFNPTFTNTGCCSCISWYSEAKLRFKFVHFIRPLLFVVILCMPLGTYWLRWRSEMPFAIFSVNGFFCHRYTVRHHRCVGKRRQ